ncbi:uncharacterized protein AB9W97_013757 isoform 2-T3 [Spinachia spinachia]
MVAPLAGTTFVSPIFHHLGNSILRRAAHPVWGQLGFEDDRIQTATSCLLNYSQLGEVTWIQAGDSYSAAVTGSREKNSECVPSETKPCSETFVAISY